MASEQGVVAVTVMTGLRRRVPIVASLKGEFLSAFDIDERRSWVLMVGEGGFVGGGVGGKRSLAASQSSSTNYSSSVLHIYS